MQMLRGEFYLRRDFEVYDSGLVAVVGPMLPHVYDILRRFVWRSLEEGADDMRQHYREGLLVARVSQTMIGELLGISRKTTCLTVATLKRLGWVRILPPADGDSAKTGYCLGEVVSDSMGQRHEVLYADACLKGVWDALCSRAEAQGVASPRRLPVETRVAIVRELLGGALTEVPNEGGDTPPVTPGEQGVSRPGYKGCYAGVTGGVTPTGHISREGEVENKEVEKEKHPAREARRGVSDRAPLYVSDSRPTPARKTAATGAPTETYTDSSEPVVVKPAASAQELAAQYRAATLAQRQVQFEKTASNEQRRENLKGRSVAVPARKAVGELAALWQQKRTERFPDTKFPAWEARSKESKLLADLVEKYEAPTVSLAVHYLFDCWEGINARIFKGNALAPSVGMLTKLHETLFLEAQVYAQAMGSIREYEQLTAADAYAELPEGLQARYDKAVAQLKTLGVTR